MRPLALLLKAVAPVFGIVGVLHLALGVGADVWLGARLPAEALNDATLDSQNRFYGVAFSLYGVLLYLCATDLRKYATVLRCVLWVFFTAGLARLVSIAAHGLPPQPVLALLVTELALPPLLHLWLSKVLAQANPSSRLASDGVHRPLMPQSDPNAPMFDLFVGNDLVAHLYDPRREEMFWWSYSIAPVSEEADLILHDEATWKEVRFTIRDRGRALARGPDAPTFNGGDYETFAGGDFVVYCRRETDRLSFRSLGPIDQ